MKEFQSHTGGRHAYNSDFKNLQELALAMQEIFRECGGNFIISGGNVTITNGSVSVSEGYAYIGNKVRKVSAADNLQTTNLYIVPKERSSDPIPYADGNSYPQYVDYYAEAVNTATPGEVCIAYNGTTQSFPDLATVFFNHYAVCKRAGKQSIDNIEVNESFVAYKQLLAKSGIQLGNNSTNIVRIGNELCLQNGNCSLCFSDNGVITIKRNGQSIMSFSDTSGYGTVTFENVTVKQELRTPKLFVGGVDISRQIAPLGTVSMWAGLVSKIPENYRLCNGDAISKTEFPELYNVIKDTFNTAPDNSGRAWAPPAAGTYRLPDLRGRFIAGYDTGSTSYRAIGSVGGAEKVLLVGAECAIPSHYHWYAADDEVKNINLSGVNGQGYVECGHGPAGRGDGGIAKTSSTSGIALQAHENRPPYYILAYIMRVK